MNCNKKEARTPQVLASFFDGTGATTAF